MSRILFFGRFADNDTPSGPERFSEELVKAFGEEKGKVVSYFFAGDTYPLFTKLFGRQYRKSPVPHTVLGIIPLVLYLFIYRPVLVHILAFERAAQLFIYLQKIFGYKIVYSAHGCIREEDRKKPDMPRELAVKNYTAELQLLRGSDAVVCVSEKLKSTITSNYSGVRQFAIIPPGITLSAFPEREEHTPCRMFLYARNPLRRAYIIKFLTETELPSGLHITVIDEPLFKVEYPVRPNLTILPALNKNEWSKFPVTQDIYLNVSGYETFSLVSLEAMAAGVITILNTDTGLTEHINKDYPFVYEAGDTASVLNLLNRIIAFTPEEMNKARKVCREAAGHLTLENTAQKYLSLYRSIVV